MNSFLLFVKNYGLRLLGVSLALFIYLRFDTTSLGVYIQNVVPLYFLATIVCVNVVVLLQSWRGYVLLGGERTKLSFKSYTHSYFVTMAASALLPGRIGAVTQVPLLFQHGVGVETGFVNVLYDKLCDLAGFLAIAAIFSTLLTTEIVAIDPVFLVFGSILILIVIWYVDVLFKFALIRFGRFVPGVNIEGKDLNGTLNARVKVYAILLTVVRLGGAITVHWLCALAAGLDLSIVLVGAAAAFGALSTLIPISVMGVGVREGIFLVLFAKSDYAQEQILAYAFLLLLAYLSTALIGTFISLVFRNHYSRERLG